jgi:hypothetical protein
LFCDVSEENLDTDSRALRLPRLIRRAPLVPRRRKEISKREMQTHTNGGAMTGHKGRTHGDLLIRKNFNFSANREPRTIFSPAFRF